MAWLQPGGFIYALKNPITQEYYYVGQTIQKITERLGKHITAAKCDNHPKYDITRQIIAANFSPEIVLLETVLCESFDKATKQLNKREEFWIGKLTNEGFLLTNINCIPYNRIRDLTNKNILNMKATKRCKNCEAEFEPKRSTADFCSTNCRVKWNRDNASSGNEKKVQPKIQIQDLTEKIDLKPVTATPKKSNIVINTTGVKKGPYMNEAIRKKLGIK